MVLCPSGFGPPRVWTPGPNLLADLDPRASISASGFGPLLADLDPPPSGSQRNQKTQETQTAENENRKFSDVTAYGSQ